ncbi:cytochrome P450 [Phlebopus sp. FC_14]|nr:cytochrome P450 [Phlebopus sp. FC_14]
MLFKPTPGLAFLSRWASLVVLPAGITALLVTRVLSFSLGRTLRPAFTSAIAVFGVPIILSVSIFARERSQHRRAAALGARLIPRIRGRWPGNADELWNMVRRAETDYIGQALWEQNKIHGPTVNLRFLWEDIIVTTEPQHVKTILATDFNNYVKGEKFKEMADAVLGTGGFNSDGDTWKLHRTMTRPFFSIDRISHFDIFDRHAEAAVSLMKERFRSGLAIDFQDLISRFTLDSATEFLFGHSMDTMSSELPYPHGIPKPSRNVEVNIAQDFAKAFTEAQHTIAKRNMIGQTWPLFEIFVNRAEKPMEIVNAFLEPILHDAIEKHNTSKHMQKCAQERDGETLLDHLIHLTTDVKVLKDETLNILLAGRDTTASTLTLAIYLLAMHPEALSRLREEVLEKVGPTRRPTYDDIREMKYLRAVLNETLRLFPVVYVCLCVRHDMDPSTSTNLHISRPFNVRECVSDTTLSSPNPGGKPLFLPAGTTVYYSVLLMHRRKDLWGPDALEFDPDRFLDHRLREYLTPSPFIFLPFNAGPRICLGQQFAYNEMSFMLVRLLQNFSSLSLSPESQDPSARPPPQWANGEGRQAIEKFHPRNHLTLYAKGGMWVKMEIADQ